MKSNKEKLFFFFAPKVEESFFEAGGHPIFEIVIVGVVHVAVVNVIVVIVNVVVAIVVDDKTTQLCLMAERILIECNFKNYFVSKMERLATSESGSFLVWCIN